MEERFKNLEQRVTHIESQIFNLHTTSMAFVNDKFDEMEHRLLDRIDKEVGKLSDEMKEERKLSYGDKIRRLSSDFGWIVAIAAIIAEYLMRSKP